MVNFASQMLIEVLKSKIHRAKVTQAELNYTGSITLDLNLMEAANLLPNEKVHILNINNGERFETYVIEGERGSGVVCLNGPAARLVQVGDPIIVISYAFMEIEVARVSKPILVFPNEHNQLVYS